VIEDRIKIGGACRTVFHATSQGCFHPVCTIPQNQFAIMAEYERQVRVGMIEVMLDPRWINRSYLTAR
jgi:hypothetical protein